MRRRIRPVGPRALLGSLDAFGVLAAVAACVACAASAAAPARAQPYTTLGPGSCGLGQANCHAKQSEWWQNDAHKRGADPFINGDEDYLDLARRVGIDPKDDAALNTRCLVCHGTVVGGAEASPVEDGVSCESCHGPGSGYKDPHQENRAAGVAKGMAELNKTDVRAEACVRCHLTTDQDLLRKGHPQGWTKPGKFTQKIQSVASVPKHWKEFVGEDQDNAPFERAIAKRGPIREVAVEAAPDAAAPPTRDDDGPAASAPAALRREIPPIERPLRAAPAASPLPLDLGPFPAIADSASVDDVLVAVKRRLDRIYERLKALATGG